MVDALVNLLLVVQHHEGLGRYGVSIEDKTEVAPLAFHVGEVDEGGVKPGFVWAGRQGWLKGGRDTN